MSRKAAQKRIRFALASQGLTPAAKLVLIVIAARDPHDEDEGYYELYWGDVEGPTGLSIAAIMGALHELVEQGYVRWDGDYYSGLWLNFGVAPPLDAVQRHRAYKALVEKYTERCGYCGSSEGPFHLDHKIPRSRGGSNDLSNLWIACAACNLTKGDRTHHEWVPQPK